MRDDGKRSRFESHRKRKKRKLQKRVVRDLFFDEGSGIGSALFSSRQKGFFGGKREKNLKLIRQTIYLSPQQAGVFPPLFFFFVKSSPWLLGVLFVCLVWNNFVKNAISKKL